MANLRINGRDVTVDADPDTPLLWVIRDHVNLTGHQVRLRRGPVRGMHGASGRRRDPLVHHPLADVEGGAITTIEGLSADGSHRVQQAWLAEQVPQCGYCQPGMIMAAAALLADTPQPSDADIDTAMTNLCRCGTYDRVRRAIHRAAQA